MIEQAGKKVPCGECYLQRGERCDICGALEQPQEPDAFMFSIRYNGQGRSSQFAAIDYIVPHGQTLIAKEPLYLRPPLRELSDADLLGAIARGWCAPINSSKTMDPDLVNAIAAEVRALLAKARKA